MDVGEVNIWGACCGNKELLCSLLEKGAPVNMKHDGSSLLMVRIMMGHHRLVQPLLEHGADVSVSNKNGFTALLAASMKGK